MSAGQRPGGLTALAVVNFVLFALGLLGLLGMAFLVGLVELPAEMEPEVREAVDRMRAWPLRWVYLGLNAASTFLLLFSGIGYLRLKRVLGRHAGNAYALLALAGVGLGLEMQPFQVGTLIGLVYPVLTLALVNTVFREDLVL